MWFDALRSQIAKLFSDRVVLAYPHEQVPHTPRVFMRAHGRQAGQIPIRNQRDLDIVYGMHVKDGRLNFKVMVLDTDDGRCGRARAGGA